MTVEGDVTLVLERITDEWQRCEALGHRFDWEFLPSPEPVQFKDGDAIRYTGKADAVHGSVRVYLNGLWYNPLGGRANEEYIRDALADGRAVRLVPEANGD